MNFEIGTWYGFANVIFKVNEILDEHPYSRAFGRCSDRAIKLDWFQRVDHFKETHIGFNWLFEVYDNERYIYNMLFDYDLKLYPADEVFDE